MCSPPWARPAPGPGRVRECTVKPHSGHRCANRAGKPRPEGSLEEPPFTFPAGGLQRRAALNSPPRALRTEVFVNHFLQGCRRQGGPPSGRALPGPVPDTEVGKGCWGPWGAGSLAANIRRALQKQPGGLRACLSP